MAERLNRTLVKSARFMLLDANLSSSYWAEAVSTAAYLKNCCPTRVIQGKTPYEAWHGEKQSVDHLRVFGYDAYAHVPKEKQESAFCSAMGKKRKVTDSMSLKRYCTVEIYNSMRTAGKPHLTLKVKTTS